MSYKVIKKVKGNYYLYLQESYRDSSGKPRTKSKYIGKVLSSSVADVRYSSKEITKKILEFEKKEEKKDVSKLSLQKVTPKLKITSKVNLSHLSLKSDYSLALKKLSKQYDIKDYPTINIKKGSKLESFKTSKDNLDYTLKIPNTKGIRSKAKAEYKKVFGKMELDLLEKQNPKKYEKLKNAFQESQENTKQYLKDYISNTAYKDKAILKLSLQMFGYMNQVGGGRLKVDSSKLGLSSYGKLNDWKNEFAYIKSQNSKKFKEAVKKELQLCYASKSALKNENVGILRKGKHKKDIEKINARIHLQNELMKKIEIIENLYS